jgi:FkbM family methyltransferase
MFVEREFNGRYKVKLHDWQRLPASTDAGSSLPDPNYKWQPGSPARSAYAYDYENARTFSMETRLKKGDVLFDIGTADGWLSAIYAQFVGGENMCLFEPSAAAWPVLKSVWEANNLPTPRDTFWGFVGDTTQLRPTESLIENEVLEYRNGWPEVAYQDIQIDKLGYRSLLSTGRNIPQVTIDDFIKMTGSVPNGISIDVEGAELLVLRGTERTLKMHKPLIWLSLHDINGALTYDYHTTKDEVFAFLTACGYKMTWLENYGDSHWLCEYC